MHAQGGVDEPQKPETFGLERGPGIDEPLFAERDLAPGGGGFGWSQIPELDALVDLVALLPGDLERSLEDIDTTFGQGVSPVCGLGFGDERLDKAAEFVQRRVGFEFGLADRCEIDRGTKPTQQ